MENSTNLKIYDSLNELTKRMSDFSNVYILPAICLFGIASNSIIILISARLIRQHRIFSHVLITALSDLLFLVSQLPLFLIRCGILCPYGYSQWAKSYELYVFWFVGYSIVTFQFFLNISVSLERLILFFKVDLNSSRKVFQHFYLKCVGFLIAAIVLNTPGYILSMNVTPLGILNQSNSTVLLYVKQVKNEYKTQSLQLLLTIIAVLKEPLLIVLLCLIDLFVLVKFKQHIKLKAKLSNKGDTWNFYLYLKYR